MEPYKESVPKTGLSLERATSRVPADGYYYILDAGETRGRYRSLKQARRLYRELLVKGGWEPARRQSEDRAGDISREAVERYLDDLQAYWGDSHKHTKRGGKTMYRS